MHTPPHNTYFELQRKGIHLVIRKICSIKQMFCLRKSKEKSFMPKGTKAFVRNSSVLVRSPSILFTTNQQFYLCTHLVCSALTRKYSRESRSWRKTLVYRQTNHTRYTVVIFKGKKTMKVEIITKMQVKREEC